MQIPALTHPAWLVYGILAVVAGIWMIRWASRNNMASAIKDATVGAAIDAMKGSRGPGGKSKKVASFSVRQSLSQILGITGFILVTAGILAAIMSAYYP